MEDWYLALHATQRSIPDPLDVHTSVMESLDAMPDFISTHWLNAILRHLFWAWGRPQQLKDGSKPPPSSNPSSSAPSHPGPPHPSSPNHAQSSPRMAKPASASTSPTTHPPSGEMRITVSALATISLPKKKEDKPYEVSLVLAVVVKKLVGNMIVKFKKPPSNRMWHTFTTLPKWNLNRARRLQRQTGHAQRFTPTYGQRGALRISP
ncbi:hypothetical protein M422DRAFT_250248 [Sphaerobolus stellatus SS14]|uniref:Uncharacterized protein n=1 Tax=Sphaerobolus stellatus (strain SS14) TaxID=990650 RepID=A0A0C9W382_SPHS4|nr:hypothetical protein M422DRAFT_250248 [Sphaerobolus stellatus SS14]